MLRLCSSAITGQEEVNQQGEIPKSNLFVVMMNLSQQQALRKKPKAGDPPVGEYSSEEMPMPMTASGAAGRGRGTVARMSGSW